jgi:hypothetical protein
MPNSLQNPSNLPPNSKLKTKKLTSGSFQMIVLLPRIVIKSPSDLQWTCSKGKFLVKWKPHLKLIPLSYQTPSNLPPNSKLKTKKLTSGSFHMIILLPPIVIKSSSDLPWTCSKDKCLVKWKPHLKLITFSYQTPSKISPNSSLVNKKLTSWSLQMIVLLPPIVIKSPSDYGWSQMVALNWGQCYHLIHELYEW